MAITVQNLMCVTQWVRGYVSHTAHKCHAISYILYCKGRMHVHACARIAR